MTEDLNTSGWRRWMRPPLAVLLAAMLVLVLLAGLIVATYRAGPGVAPCGDLTQRTWTLTRLVVDGCEQPLVPRHAPTLTFGRCHGQIDGEMGCNSYTGTYTLAGETLHFSGLFFTLVGCVPPAPREQENAYSEALPRVERYHLAGNTLVLVSADRRVQLTFRAT
jgi:heat shock protein HslJ